MDINRGTFEVVASRQICDKYGAPVAYTFREDDATLYAAARELLAALLLILPLAKGYAPTGQSLNARQTCNSWITAAEEAIAKATGADQ